MTDDISKVVRKIALEMKAHRAMGSRIEELDSWSRQLNEAIESATTPAEVGEVDHFAVSWRGDWNSTMRGYAEEYARRANATIAHQLAEAKAAAERHERNDILQMQRAIKAESHLAEAVRRLGEVEGLLLEALPFVNDVAHDAETWMRIDAALKKDPNKHD